MENNKRLTSGLKEVSVTPLVDVMVILFVIVLVTAPKLERKIEPERQ